MGWQFPKKRYKWDSHNEGPLNAFSQLELSPEKVCPVGDQLQVRREVGGEMWLSRL